VTIRGPALAALCLFEWLQLQAPEPSEDADSSDVVQGGSLELLTEMAELWVELPLPLLYQLIADSPSETATLRRIATEHRSAYNKPHVATYVLRLEMPSLRNG
jgi:hypothetical protein